MNMYVPCTHIHIHIFMNVNVPSTYKFLNSCTCTYTFMKVWNSMYMYYLSQLQRCQTWTSRGSYQWRHEGDSEWTYGLVCSDQWLHAPPRRFHEETTAQTKIGGVSTSCLHGTVWDLRFGFSCEIHQIVGWGWTYAVSQNVGVSQDRLCDTRRRKWPWARNVAHPCEQAWRGGCVLHSEWMQASAAIMWACQGVWLATSMAQRAQEAHERRHLQIAEQTASDHFVRVLCDPEYWGDISYQEQNNNLLLANPSSS